ncbi:hypothetical protein HMPREF0742_01459, partial [Rothia aeria F0184]
KTNIGFPPPLFRTCRIAATYLAYEKKLLCNCAELPWMKGYRAV